MNDYLLSVLLGVIEGLTEFLPVSSTAHLRIAESFLGIDLGTASLKLAIVDDDGRECASASAPYAVTKAAGL